MAEEQNGWNEWHNFVLQELKRFDANIEKMNAKLNEMAIIIAELKMRAGIWGLIGASIPIIIIILVEKFVK